MEINVSNLTAGTVFDEGRMQRFKDLLDRQHEWPGPYTFKFIIRPDDLVSLFSLFPNAAPRIRPSAQGRFIAVTYDVTMEGPDEVVQRYREASQVESVMAL